MKKTRLNEMTGGWFIGNFNPSVHKTNAVEVAIKVYKEGDSEKTHYHKIATEYTVIIKGEVLMNNTKFVQGDIVEIMPFEESDFKALTDVITAVIKLPGANNDKYNSHE